MRRGAITAALLISACAPSQPATMAKNIPQQVQIGAEAFDAQAQNGALYIRRIGAPLTYSDGYLAKQAGQAVCAGRLNPAAFGHFIGGAWAFKGGCV